MTRSVPSLLPLWSLCLATLLWSPGCSSSPERYDRGMDAWNRVAEEPPERTPAALDENSSLKDQLLWAEFHNPAVQAASQRWLAALEKVPQVSDLPDPRVTFGWFVDEVETRTGPMDWRLGISQSFPWFGTLDLAGQVALEQAEAAREFLVAAKLEVAREVRDAWYELAYVGAAIEVTAGHLDLLVSWESVARTRYATALGTDADVIRAQVELGKLDDRLRSLKDLMRPLAARLNAALNRPAQAPLPTTTLGQVGIDAAQLAELGLFERLDETSPALRAMRWAVDAAGDRIQLADKQFYPNF